MRLGVYGGSFDPIHYGHLLLAECCREQLALDQVWFVPAALAPHKRGAPPTPAAQRIEMLELAIAGHDSFRVCRHEVDRGGVSFTVDTLAALAAEHPSAELYFLLGADSLVDLPGWRQPKRICELAILAVVGRPAAPPVDWSVLDGVASAQRLAEFAHHQVEMPQVGLSSSDLRARVASGRSIRYRTPRAVECYIGAQGLYQEGLYQGR